MTNKQGRVTRRESATTNQHSNVRYHTNTTTTTTNVQERGVTRHQQHNHHRPRHVDSPDTQAEAFRAAYDDDEEEEEEEEEDDIHPWVQHYCNTRGMEYLTEVDREFLLDKFNLTALGHVVPHASAAYERICSEEIEFIERVRVPGSGNDGSRNGNVDAVNGGGGIVGSLVIPEWVSEKGGNEKVSGVAVEASAKLLYGLIHARFIISPAGLSKMVSC